MTYWVVREKVAQLTPLQLLPAVILTFASLKTLVVLLVARLPQLAILTLVGLHIKARHLPLARKKHRILFRWTTRPTQKEHNNVHLPFKIHPTPMDCLPVKNLVLTAARTPTSARLALSYNRSAHLEHQRTAVTLQSESRIRLLAKSQPKSSMSEHQHLPSPTHLNSY